MNKGPGKPPACIANVEIKFEPRQSRPENQANITQYHNICLTEYMI